MNPYVPLLFTLFVGVVGGFFDKTKKTVAKQSHENGIPPENALGGDEQELPSRESLFPKLTRAGVLLLILYVGSCCFSLYTAYQNVKDTDNKAQIAKQETTDAKNRAETLQVELQSAQDALSDLRKENLQQFKGVGEHLTQNGQLGSDTAGRKF